MEYSIDQTGITSDSEKATTLYRWSFFDRYAESPRSFAIEGKRVNFASRVFFVIPKSACATPLETDALRELLRANVLPEAVLQRQGAGAIPIHTSEVLPASDAPSALPPVATAEEDALLDRGFYEHSDFDISSVGWRRKVIWNRWSLFTSTTWALGALASAAIAIYMMATLDVFWGVLLFLPGCMVWSFGRAIVFFCITLAGPAKQWDQHVLSYGPASVILRADGVLFRSVQHEMLFKNQTVIAAIESPGAFSIVSRQWEAIIPKRMLSADAAEHIRQALASRFPLQSIPRGKTLVLTAPPEE